MVNLTKKYVDEKKLIKINQLMFEILNKADDKDDFFEVIKRLIFGGERLLARKRWRLGLRERGFFGSNSRV